MLSAEDQALVRVSGAIAARRGEALRDAIREAVGEADPGRLEEVLLQSHLFVGYPVALEALSIWREERKQAPEVREDDEPRVWEVRGPRVCSRVYGRQYEALLRNVRTIHPVMAGWMVGVGYGRVLGRPGLSLAVRELCIVSLLEVLDTPEQLHSHLRGALNVGASARAVREALELAGEHASPEARARADTVWKAVWERWTEGGANASGAPGHETDT